MFSLEIEFNLVLRPDIIFSNSNFMRLLADSTNFFAAMSNNGHAIFKRNTLNRVRA